ncbi:MAG: S9 family peptidase, partial [Polyangiaceae bacterium]|nr:S9 family peptidase [Polyangiaceae bacterium]
MGWDGSPAWSPDGRHIAFRSQARDGYEADRFRLAVVERATAKANYDLLPTPSLSVAELVWAPDSKAIYVGVDRQGEAVVFA